MDQKAIFKALEKNIINFFLQKHHKFSNLKDAWAVCFITLIQKLKKKFN